MQHLINTKASLEFFNNIYRSSFEAELGHRGTLKRRSKVQIVELASDEFKVKQHINNKSIAGLALPKMLTL
jgi:hypothetical protein